jgi:hypothetical protein
MRRDATISQLLARIEVLESQNAIRRTLADYMRLCDHLDDATPMDELAALFTSDAVWAGRGTRYAATFGSYQGRDAIVAMLDRYRAPVHFAFNAHFLTSESIAIDGGVALGEWMMLQTSTYVAGSSDLRAARLKIGFRRESRWRIYRFETFNLFSRPVDRWDDPSPVPVPVPLSPTISKT